MKLSFLYAKLIIFYFAFFITDTHQTIGMFYDISGFFTLSFSLFIVILSFSFVALVPHVSVNYRILCLSLLFIIYIFFNFRVEVNLGVAKLIILVSMLIVLCFSKNILENSRELVNKFLKLLVFLSVLKVMLFLLFVDISIIKLLSNPSESRFLYSFFLNPIYLARSSGLAILALIFLKKNNVIKYSAPLFIILFFGLYISGSRAPVIALLSALFVLYVYGNYKNKILTTIFGVFCSSLVVIVFQNELMKIILSFFVRNNDSLDSAVEDRFSLLLIAKEMFLNNKFLGEGLGAFANYSYLGYPHNLIMEVLSELGILGGLFLLLTFIAGMKLRKSDLFFIFFIYTFINSLSSGSLSNNVAILIVVIWGSYIKYKYVIN